MDDAGVKARLEEVAEAANRSVCRLGRVWEDADVLLAAAADSIARMRELMEEARKEAEKSNAELEGVDAQLEALAGMKGGIAGLRAEALGRIKECQRCLRELEAWTGAKVGE
jgi:hypothetical protein